MDEKVKTMSFCLDKVTKMPFLEEKKIPSKRCRFVFKQQIPFHKTFSLICFSSKEHRPANNLPVQQRTKKYWIFFVSNLLGEGCHGGGG
jgi:hypothetical protein